MLEAALRRDPAGIYARMTFRRATSTGTSSSASPAGPGDPRSRSGRPRWSLARRAAQDRRLPAPTWGTSFAPAGRARAAVGYRASPRRAAAPGRPAPPEPGAGGRRILAPPRRSRHSSGWPDRARPAGSCSSCLALLPANEVALNVIQQLLTASSARSACPSSTSARAAFPPESRTAVRCHAAPQRRAVRRPWKTSRCSSSPTGGRTSTSWCSGISPTHDRGAG